MSDSARQKAELIIALKDAKDGLEEMIGYVPEYFVYKWDLKSYIKRAEDALEVAENE